MPKVIELPPYYRVSSKGFVYNLHGKYVGTKVVINNKKFYIEKK